MSTDFLLIGHSTSHIPCSRRFADSGGASERRFASGTRTFRCMSEPRRHITTLDPNTKNDRCLATTVKDRVPGVQGLKAQSSGSPEGRQLNNDVAVAVPVRIDEQPSAAPREFGTLAGGRSVRCNLSTCSATGRVSPIVACTTLPPPRARQGRPVHREQAVPAVWRMFCGCFREPG
jgi:hypothetical protein